MMMHDIKLKLIVSNNWISQAALPECPESPSGSSLGSLDTLGVAHPTRERKYRRTDEKREDPEQVSLYWCSGFVFRPAR